MTYTPTGPEVSGATSPVGFSASNTLRVSLDTLLSPHQSRDPSATTRPWSGPTRLRPGHGPQESTDESRRYTTREGTRSFHNSKLFVGQPIGVFFGFSTNPSTGELLLFCLSESLHFTERPPVDRSLAMVGSRRNCTSVREEGLRGCGRRTWVVSSRGEASFGLLEQPKGGGLYVPGRAGLGLKYVRSVSVCLVDWIGR